ncbi:helix-turn-helix domain-containing protein [uncultured Sphingomonas sp.]|uniref:helix-turn-helix domain-containing protein n=1 Tax=uncultured Sphingomonas sp. TaxID=158754 RepID=UPI0037498903
MNEVTILVLPDGRVSREEAARFLGYKPKTLAEWHRLGKGPKSRMVGGRRFYDIADLREFAGQAA